MPTKMELFCFSLEDQEEEEEKEGLAIFYSANHNWPRSSKYFANLHQQKIKERYRYKLFFYLMLFRRGQRI